MCTLMNKGSTDYSSVHAHLLDGWFWFPIIEAPCGYRSILVKRLWPSMLLILSLNHVCRRVNLEWFAISRIIIDKLEALLRNGKDYTKPQHIIAHIFPFHVPSKPWGLLRLNHKCYTLNNCTNQKSKSQSNRFFDKKHIVSVK